VEEDAKQWAVRAVETFGQSGQFEIVLSPGLDAEAVKLAFEAMGCKVETRGIYLRVSCPES